MQRLSEKSPNWWVCLCGNELDQDGFSPCNSEAEPVASLPYYWNGAWYRCNQCGRMFDRYSLIVLGVSFNSTVTREEREEIYSFEDRYKLARKIEREKIGQEWVELDKVLGQN